MQKENIRYYFMLICAMLIYGTTGVFRKLILFSSPLLAAFRGLLGALFIFAFCLITKKKIFAKITKKELIILIISGALIGLNWIFLFESYNYTSVAVATLCYYMEPTFVILLSPLFLKEKLTVKKLVCALISVGGMVLVSGVIEEGGINLSQITGILFALGGAIIYAIVVILNKKTPEVDGYQKTTIQLGSTLIAIIPYLLLTEDFSAIQCNTTTIILTIILGIVNTGIAYALFFGSMKELKGQTVAILSYIDPVTSLILSALILKEHMTVLGIIGAVLIIGSALISEINIDFKKIKRKLVSLFKS